MAEPWDSMRALFPDNTSGEISAADMRSQVDLLEANDADNLKGASAQNILINPGDAQDISDVVAGITDATTTKRYQIQLTAGEHTTKPVTMKPYVYISGSNKDAVVVKPTTVNDTVFTLVDFSIVDTLIVDGATAGKAFYMSTSGHTHLEDVGITNCAIGLHINHADALVLADINWNFTIGTGIYVTAGNVTLDKSVLLADSVFTNIVHISGATALGTLSHIESFSSNVATGIRVDSGARVVINNPSIVNATTAMVIEGSSQAVVKSGKFVLCDTGVSVPNTGGSPELELTGLSVINNTENISILNPATNIIGMGVCDFYNSTVASGVTITASVVDQTEGDEGLQVFGELKVGSPAAPAETCLGEGDSYSGVGRMYVYSWSGVAWNDETAAASSASGSTFSFPNGNVNSALYFASAIPEDGSFVKHGGLKIDVVTPTDNTPDVSVTGVTSPASAGDYYEWTSLNGQVAYRRNTLDYWLFFVDGRWVLIDSEPDEATKWNEGTHWSFSLDGTYAAIGAATGTPAVVLNGTTPSPFVLEYWDYDSASWEELNYMMTDSGNSYQSYGKQIFEHSGSFQLRYDILLENDKSWGTTDPMSLGTQLFWVRCRIVSTLTSSPVIQQVKIHSNRMEINSDGYVEFFGKSRPYRRLPWDSGLIQGVGVTVGDQDMYLGDNLLRGYRENAMGTGDQVGFNSYLPNDIDTSTPVRLNWSFASTATHTDVTWTVRWGYSQDGDNVYTTTGDAPATGPNEQSATVVAPLGVANTQYSVAVDLDISDMLPTREGAWGDIIWITIERTSGGSATDINLINIQPLYASHVLGGHI